MTTRHPIRLASNTKTYIAAAVLRLWEEGAIDLNSTLGDHLPQDYLRLLDSDGYNPAAITIRHLLTHTSGLFDYATSETYGDQVLSNPTGRWSRIEQLQGAVDWGDPYGAPGEVFHYSDTGYILLGLVIEQQTGQNLAVALRELVQFSRLGLDNTWWETLEPKPLNTMDRAHQYYGEVDIYPFDPSFDSYGGGGLVSTMEDPAVFMRALFTGDVFRDRETIDVMLITASTENSSNPSNQPLNPYRMGVSVTELGGYKAYFHEGFWGTAAAYFPDIDTVIAVSINQGETDQLWQLVEKTFDIIGKATKATSELPQ